MSSFDHNTLTRDINSALRPFRQSQSGVMQAFAQLAQRQANVYERIAAELKRAMMIAGVADIQEINANYLHKQ